MVFSRLLFHNNNNNNYYTFLNKVHCCFQDTRFNHDIDARTGYKTHSLLCMPIKDFNGEVMGVAQVSFERHSSIVVVPLYCVVLIVLFYNFQVINKKNAPCFTQNDEKVFSDYLQFCGIGLRNAQLYEKSQLEVKRNQVRNFYQVKLWYIGHLDLLCLIYIIILIMSLWIIIIFINQVLLDLARMIFEEQSTIEHMVFRILTHTQSLIQCQRVQVLVNVNTMLIHNTMMVIIIHSKSGSCHLSGGYKKGHFPDTPYFFLQLNGTDNFKVYFCC